MQKRLMFVAILLLAICNRIVAEDQITIGDFSLYSGDTKAVSVMLTNEDSYVGFQFDLYLPDGISVESFSANSSRIPEGTTPQMSQQSDGSYRFVAAALERNPIVGNEGAILTLTVKAGENVAAKDYTGYLRNIKISKTDGTGVTKDEQSFTITVRGDEAYVVLSDNTLTFYYDKQGEKRSDWMPMAQDGSSITWGNYAAGITKVVFDSSFANCTTITSTANWFNGFTTLVSIEGIENLKTDNVTNMSNMFYGCSSLTSLDVSNFKTQNVTNMSQMFTYCKNLTSLDLSNFNTEKVTSMMGMFGACVGLTSLNVSSFNTSSVTDMYTMFSNCPGLTTLDVSGFNTQNVTRMSSMFGTCRGLTSLDLSSFNTSSVTDMNNMFNYCTKLTTIYTGEGWSTEAVTDGGGMFAGCDSLVGGMGTVYDANHIDATYAHIDGGPDNPGYFTDIADYGKINEPYAVLSSGGLVVTFYYDKKKEERGGIDINNSYLDDNSSSPYGSATTAVIDVSFADYRPTSTSYWFQSCSSLTRITGMENLKTDNVTDMSLMFRNCSSLTSLDVTGFNTQNVFNMTSMFDECSGLKSLDVTGFNTQKVRYMGWMFYNCSSLTSLDVSHFDTQNVTIMSSMFLGCSSLTSLDLSCFNTQNVTEMARMFRDCSSLTTIYAGSDWSTVAVTEGSNMFINCTNLKGGAGTVYNTNHTDYTYAHIDGGTANPGYFTDIADLGKVNEPYAILTGDTISGMTLTFYYDKRKEERNGMSVGPFAYSDGRGWNTVCSSITKVVFNSSMAEYTSLESTANWFDNCTNLSTIQGIENLKTDSVTDMHFMFSDCAALASINVSGFDMSNVTSTRMMFQGCRALENINLTGWNTQSLTDIYGMFMDCSDLRSVDLSVLNTSSVTNMRDVFAGCDSLTTVNLRGFNTSNVTTMWGMFRNSAVTSLDLSSFNTVKVTDMANMFLNCNALNTIYVGGDWTTSAVTSSENMFGTCYNLVGGSGTVYNYSYTDASYAHIDGGPDNPGYFTDIADLGKVNEPYAVLTGDTISGMTLTFYYDKKKEERNGMDVGPFTVYWDYDLQNNFINSGWNSERDKIVAVVFNPSFEDYKSLTNISYWFNECKNLTTISGIQYLKTDSVTDMRYMFNGCVSLTSLDVSGFNTANVTDMRYMFNGCVSLTSLDVSGFNTANVTNMIGMFESCEGLTSLDLSNFNTANVTNMYNMFLGCHGLTSLDVNNFNTANVTDMGHMFAGCSGLTSLNVSSFNTANVTDMRYMFCGCPSLTSLDVSNFNTQKVTSMDWMFYGSSLTSLDLSNFNTANVREMGYMFYDCSALKTIYVSDGWTVGAVTSGKGVFNGCTSLVGGMGTTYDENHTDHTYAHIDGGPDNPGYFTRSGDAPYVAPELYAVLEENASANSMVDAAPNRAATAKTYTMKFYYDGKKTERNGMSVETYREATTREWDNMAESITNVVFDLTVVNDTAITSTGYWFSGFTQLTSIEGLNYLNTSHVADTWAMFEKCSSLKEVNLSNFDTRNVKTMGLMFYGCENLLNLDVSSFNTANVTHTNSMFANCIGLTSLDLSGFNTRKVENMSEMFLNCTHLTTIYAGSDWSTESSAGGGKMFGSCYSLVGGMGTTYDENHVDGTYAHIDGGPDNPGYLTDIADLGKEREPYAALSSDGLVVTFYYDRKKEDRGGVDINTRFLNTHEATDVSPYGSATTAVFDASFADYKPTSTAYWFCKCSSLKTIRGIENLNTVDVTDMSSMFYSCDSLTSIDVSGFNTENVTNMNSMFGLCYSLARLDVSNFKTENVTNMSAMFSNCYELTNLDLSNFKTDNVTDMSHMFSGSWNLTSVNLSGFNTKNVKDMSFMFYGCFDLQSLDISHFNTANVTNMRTMFYGCSFSSLDLSGFNTAKVTEMSAMFSSCRSLKTIFAGEGWSTAKVEDGIDMFMECTSLVGGMGTAYDSLHIDYTYARIDQGPSNPGYFTDIKGPSQKVATPSLAWTDDMLTISTTTEDATIRYTISDIGNGRDTLTYSAPIEVKRDIFIRTWAEHMGMFASDTITLDYPYTAWQQLREAIDYSMITVAICEGSPKVKQDEVIRLKAMADMAADYYSKRQLQRNEIESMTGELMVLSAMLRSQLEAVEYAYDSANGVLTISGGTTLAEALSAAGGTEEVAKTITAIVWNSTASLTNGDLKGLDNPNMLIYVADASLAPANRDNVIIGNDSIGYTAKNIVLTDVTEGNGDFYCPIAFTAEMISYTHEYRQQTEVGVARGWETIAMPFTVQTIMHEKNGLIAPFGNDASTKHFWLRQLTQQGLAQARQIEANTPYLISMPNSDAYPVEFNQAGRVTFSSQNATVPVTQLNVMEAPTATGGMVMIQPNFKGQSATSMIYALNVGVPRGDHPEGSVFEANYRSVRPFEAFTVHHGDGPAPQFVPIKELNGGTTGIDDVRSLMSDGRGENWYDMNGRRLQGRPTQKGIYLYNGRKVVIK